MSPPTAVRADLLAEGIYKRLVARDTGALAHRHRAALAAEAWDAAEEFVAYSHCRNPVTGAPNYPGCPADDGALDDLAVEQRR